MSTITLDTELVFRLTRDEGWACLGVWDGKALPFDGTGANEEDVGPIKLWKWMENGVNTCIAQTCDRMTEIVHVDGRATWTRALSVRAFLESEVYALAQTNGEGISFVEDATGVMQLLADAYALGLKTGTQIAAGPKFA